MRNGKCKQEKADFFFFFCQIYKDVFLIYKNLLLNKEYSFHCIKDLLKEKELKKWELPYTLKR